MIVRCNNVALASNVPPLPTVKVRSRLDTKHVAMVIYGACRDQIMMCSMLLSMTDALEHLLRPYLDHKEYGSGTCN